MIETTRLKLVPCELRHFAAFEQSESALGESLGVRIAENWLAFPEAMRFGHEYLQQQPQIFGWWMYFFVHKTENCLIGNGGFKGLPNDGTVEIGYAVAPNFQNQGLAAEAARGLIDFAFADRRVSAVEAHTLAERNASTRVLEKLGMRKIAEKHDEEDGDIWQWRIERADYQNGRKGNLK